jgi:hypothetical protein
VQLSRIGTQLGFLDIGSSPVLLSAPTLTREEFVSLRDGAKGLMHRIPSEHKARLIELGYIEKVFGGIRLTAAGRARIAEG